MSKYYIQIVLAVLLFAGSAVAGYFLIPEDIFGKVSRRDEVVAVAQPKPEPYEVSQPQPPVTEPIEAAPQPAVVPSEPIVEETVVEKPIVEETVVEVSDVPEIVKVYFPKFEEWSTHNPKRIGYKVTVTAKSSTGATLKYELQSKEGKYSYTSNDGVFREVYPTDDGVYTLVVTNTQTNENATQEVKGLVKRPMRSAAWLERQLTINIGNRFYLNFAPNVKFKCYGAAIQDDSAPTTLNGLCNIAGMGYSVDVKDSTMKYDEWNRIVYFEVEIK